MFNPKLILNAASELNLSVKTNGKFYQIVKKIDQFKPKNKEDIFTILIVITLTLVLIFHQFYTLNQNYIFLKNYSKKRPT